jgi:hypothetical protein
VRGGAKRRNPGKSITTPGSRTAPVYDADIQGYSLAATAYSGYLT